MHGWGTSLKWSKNLFMGRDQVFAQVILVMRGMFMVREIYSDKSILLNEEKPLISIFLRPNMLKQTHCKFKKHWAKIIGTPSVIQCGARLSNISLKINCIIHIRLESHLAKWLPSKKTNFSKNSSEIFEFQKML